MSKSSSPDFVDVRDGFDELKKNGVYSLEQRERNSKDYLPFGGKGGEIDGGNEAKAV